MSKKNIKELVEEAGVKLVPIGEGIYRGFCPMPGHNNVNTPSFTVYNLTNSYYCFGACGSGGDEIRFYAQLHGIGYNQAKEKLQGNTDMLEEIVQTLDGLGISDPVDYAQQLNFSVSKYCRDLLYKRPELENKVMEFFKHLDKQLQSGTISAILMEKLIKESRELEK